MTAIVKKTMSDGQDPTKRLSSKLTMAFKGDMLKGSPEVSNQILTTVRTLIAMLVPLVYIAMLGIVAYFTFYHALFGSHFNQGAPFHISATLYVLPLLSGLSLTVLMLRPFFHLKQFNEHRLKLHINDGAEFLQLISLIQQRLHNTQKIEVELSMLPVVCAEPDGLSLKRSDNVTLVVGLPLIKSMTVQQLSALICHELAHYSHSSYRRAYRWTILVDQWFDDCLQSRDGWKGYFSELEQSGPNSAFVIAGLIGKSAIVLNDTVLQFLHKAYRRLSITTLKQLDRDADQSAVLLSGSLGFCESLELLGRTSKSWQYSQFRLLSQASLILTDNFVDEVYVNSKVDDAAELESLYAYLPVSWVYHPEIDERVSFARHEDVAGILNLATPATELFKHFPVLCKSVTPVYYRECGVEFSPNSLKSVPSNIKIQAAEDTYKKIIDEFTSSTFSPAVVWNVGNTRKMIKMTTSQMCTLLNATVKQFRSQLPTFQDAHIHHSNTQKDILAYHLSKLRLKHGYTSEEHVEHQAENYRYQESKLNNQTIAFEAYSRCIGVRLSAAVLLDTRKSTLAKTLTLLSNLQKLHLIQKKLTRGHQLSRMIGEITTQLYANQEVELKPKFDIYTQSLKKINRHIFASLSRLPGDLKDVNSIAKHIREQMKLKLLPGRDEASKAQDEFALLEEEFCSLNIIVTGRLVKYAMKNELAHNIEPVRLVQKPTMEKSA